MSSTNVMVIFPTPALSSASLLFSQSSCSIGPAIRMC